MIKHNAYVCIMQTYVHRKLLNIVSFVNLIYFDIIIVQYVHTNIHIDSNYNTYYISDNELLCYQFCIM